VTCPPPVQPAVRVVVVDDQADFRTAAAAVIGVTEGFALLGEVASGEDAIALLRGAEADLVLMDVNMPGLGGVGAARQLLDQHPRLAVVLLSTYDPRSLPADIADSSLAYRHKAAFGPAELERIWRSHVAARDRPGS
jgi:DNA-binding NarL/FixJ family response regulator